MGNPVIDVTPAPINDPSGGSEDVLFCGRVPVSGEYRLKVQHYASVFRVTLVPSVLIPKQWQKNIQVCYHRNSSLGLCRCEKNDWGSLQNGLWSSTISPYMQNYVDVKFADMVTGSVTISLNEDIATPQPSFRNFLYSLGFQRLHHVSCNQTTARWRYFRPNTIFINIASLEMCRGSLIINAVATMEPRCSDKQLSISRMSFFCSLVYRSGPSTRFLNNEV